jgi:hypothetical protein
MEEILSNQTSVDGMRSLKLISDAPLTEERVRVFIPSPAWKLAEVNCTESGLGVFHGEARWPCRGDMLDIKSEYWPKSRRMVAWRILPDETLRDAVSFAVNQFGLIFRRSPKYAFVKNLPEGFENCMDVAGCILLEAEWMLNKTVCVGGFR